jgi:hypothetical protein
MRSSLDTYPIEFLNMKGHHVVVFGEDVLGSLAFHPSALRLQAERELKGKILLLKIRYLETEGKGARIEALIKESITAFLSIFHALLYLRGVDIPHGRTDIVRALAEVVTFDADALLKCVEIKEGRGRFTSSDMDMIFQDYLRELMLLADIVDKMEIS